MIWYEASPVLIQCQFVLLLLTAALQLVIFLEAGELIRGDQELRHFRTLYAFLLFHTLVLLAEALLANASIEGGLHIVPNASWRHLFLFAPFLWISTQKAWQMLPVSLRPASMNFLMPLLRLPVCDTIPMPIPLLLALFSSSWFLLDALRMLYSFHVHARSELTRHALPLIIQHLRHGICVANRRGWILEANPAFYRMCGTLGMQNPERLSTLYAKCGNLAKDGTLRSMDTADGQILHVGQNVFSLSRNTFRKGLKTYTQLVISDDTDMSKTSLLLARENDNLSGAVQSLESAITALSKEAEMAERERLCRLAHDTWSQRLSVAGLSLDMLSQLHDSEPRDSELHDCELHDSEPRDSELRATAIGTLSQILDLPVDIMEYGKSGDMFVSMETLSRTYRKLGVHIILSGTAAFSAPQRNIIHHVLRESLANAVRHAYARTIHITQFEEKDCVGILMQNDCPDEGACVTEGRGLSDMRNRVRLAGGEMEVHRSEQFTVNVTFPKETAREEEEQRHAHCID